MFWFQLFTRFRISSSFRAQRRKDCRNHITCTTRRSDSLWHTWHTLTIHWPHIQMLDTGKDSAFPTTRSRTWILLNPVEWCKWCDYAKDDLWNWASNRPAEIGTDFQCFCQFDPGCLSAVSHCSSAIYLAMERFNKWLQHRSSGIPYDLRVFLTSCS